MWLGIMQLFLPRERALACIDGYNTNNRFCRTAFDELNDEERTNVLSEPMNEIVRMLEQNLLTKFQARISQERGTWFFTCILPAW